MHLEAKTLTLVLCSPEEARAQVKALPPEMRREVSPEWLKRVEDSTVADPWLHGFKMIHRETGATVGSAGFKAPPDAEGCVEIESDQVRTVRAHTLPKPSASTRVLTTCGFQYVGEVMDPEDGLVWRWEVRREQFASR